MKKIRMGLVGCGNMMGAHVGGVNQLDNIEIVAVCDMNRANAEHVAEVLGNNPKIVTDYKEFVDDVDAVLIALPHHLHFECGMFFARHKKHVLMEKPLCNTEEECIRLIETCEAEGVVLMCAYPVRFWPGVVKLKELVDSGEYGDVIEMSIWTEQLTGINIDVTGGKQNWLLTSQIGGGQLFSHGCHYVDILLWFLGNPISGAHVGTNRGTPWMLREGTSALVMKFESGAIAYHGSTWGARGTRLACSFQIHTEKGMLEYEHNSGEVRLYDGIAVHVPGEASNSQRRTVLWSRDSKVAGKETQFEITHFAECIKTGKRPITDGRSALQSLRVIWEVYNAERNDIVADLRGLGLPEIE